MPPNESRTKASHSCCADSSCLTYVLMRVARSSNFHTSHTPSDAMKIQCRCVCGTIYGMEILGRWVIPNGTYPKSPIALDAAMH